MLNLWLFKEYKWSQGTWLSTSAASFTIESSPDISRPSVVPDTEQDIDQ